MKRSLGVIVVSLALAACGDPNASGAKNMGGPTTCDPSMYPCGPYGYTMGSVIDDLQLDVVSDGNSDNTIVDEIANPKTVPFSTYFQDKGIKVLVVTVAAEWCNPCREEQGNLIDLYEKNKDKGFALVEAMIQSTNGQPADWNTVKRWAGTDWNSPGCPPDKSGMPQSSCNIPFPMAIDPAVELGPYYNVAAFPMQMIIRTSDMTIRWQNNGGGPTIEQDMQSQIDCAASGSDNC